jgi:ferric-dicitrate binding protein FerR (iron transport regulator)
MNDEREDTLAKLVRLAGPRPRPDAQRTARVREAVYEEWQRATRRRNRLRYGAGAAIAASLAALLYLQTVPKQPSAPGRIIDTARGSVTSVDWNGATLRLDGGTRVRIESPKEATLERGKLYFSSEGRTGVAIKTPFGTVRDIGTQFEARLGEDELRVRVREGIVDVRGTRAQAGSEVVATRDTVTQGPVATSGAEWAWIERAAPPIILEGLTVGAVVERAAREKGLRVEWNTERNIILHGSVALTPDEAIEAATAAAGAHYRIEGDTLIVSGRK